MEQNIVILTEEETYRYKYFITFRVTIEEDTIMERYYLENLTEWLKWKSYYIEKSSVGRHTNSKRPHLHYHLIVKSKNKISGNQPLQSLKYDFSNPKRFSEITTPFKHDHSILDKDEYGRIRINMKVNPFKQDEEQRVLQYPLKEKNPIIGKYMNLGNYNLEEIMKLANKEYLGILRTQETKEKHESKVKNEYKQVVEYLDEMKPNTKRQVAELLLQYYRDKDIMLGKHPRTIMDYVDKYSFHRGIWTTDEILEKFRL
jgi:hypothetical protein